MSTTRREFMVGCSAAIAALAGGRLSNLVFASPDARQTGLSAANGEVFVMVFLRGGCDSLSLVVPNDSLGIYATKRGPLAVAGGLEIDPQNASFASQGTGLSLHPNATLLRDLYLSQKVAFVHACGLDNDTRSHFDAMDFIERGTPNNKNTASGWLARHVNCVNPEGLLPTVAAGSAKPASLLTDQNAASLSSPDDFDVRGPYRYINDDPNKHEMLLSLERMYTGDTPLIATGQRTFKTIRALSGTLPEAGAGYPNSTFSNSLKMVAQLIKYGEVGLQVATVDLGGWDHHENEGVNETYGPFYNMIKTLSEGLHAFYNDLEAAGLMGKVTVAVQSEFGRRLGRNSTNGTDHGHGGVMTVMGGSVKGGKVYGNWPGLEDLDQKQDLRITTDYRSVLSEIVAVKLGNPKLGTVFPNLTPEIYSDTNRLGLFDGANPALDYSSESVNQVYLPLLQR